MALQTPSSTGIVAAGCLTLFLTAFTSGYSDSTVHTATSSSDTVIKCEPASTLIIRSAHYGRWEMMRAEDVMKLYRHCELGGSACDLATVGIERPFSISYYCLNLTDAMEPYANLTSATYDIADFSFFLNLTRQRYSSDLSLTCNVTSSAEQKVRLTALNLYWPKSESEMSDKGEWNGPRLKADLDIGHWAFGQVVVPWEWQLDMNVSSTMTLTFQHLNGTCFGRLWFHLSSKNMSVSCSRERRPSTLVNEQFAPLVDSPPSCEWLVNPITTSSSLSVSPTTILPTGDARNFPTGSGVIAGLSGWRLVVVGSVVCSLSVFLCLLVVVSICRRHFSHARAPKANQARTNCTEEEGQYVEIVELTSPPRLSDLALTSAGDNGQAVRQGHRGHNGVVSGPSHSPHSAPIPDDYGTLNHHRQTANADVAETLYDHMGGEWGAGQDTTYASLCRTSTGKLPVKVVDNIYDTATTVPTHQT